jgi:hypothetical protein
MPMRFRKKVQEMLHEIVRAMISACQILQHMITENGLKGIPDILEPDVLKRYQDVCL